VFHDGAQHLRAQRLPICVKRLGHGHEIRAEKDARDLAEWTVRVAEQRALGAFNAMGPAYEMGMDQLLYGIQAVTGTASAPTTAPARWANWASI
jgi:2'-hydroxyisoflavone reductase